MYYLKIKEKNLLGGHFPFAAIIIWSLVTLITIFIVRKRSCGKVMFSQACVKNSVHGGVYTPRGSWADTPFLGRHAPWADIPLDRHSPRQIPPRQTHTPRADSPHPADGYCSGRYVSYWNVFLYLLSL